MTTPTDFLLADHGSITILHPLTDEGRDWVADNLPDDATWFGRGVVIEPRYVGDIVEGIASDGLTIA